MSRAGTLAWRAEGSSHRGSSHERSGAPNQDAYAVRRVADGVVAAVADGHGGRRYVRSGTGARIAVQLATTLGAELLDVRQPDPALAGRLLPTRLVPAWRDAVLADLAAHALDDDEVERCGDLPADPTVLYGATLIVALACGPTVAVAQIGDGAALSVSGTSTRSVVPGDDRLVANETTSLCLPTALDDFRHGAVSVEGDEAPLLLLATDGYGNSFASEQWESEVMSDLATQVGRHGFDAVCVSMPPWVAESAEVGGDDVTVVLLTGGPGATGARGAGGLGGLGTGRRWWVPGLALTVLTLAAVLLVARPWVADPAATTPPVTPVADTRQSPLTTTAPPTSGTTPAPTTTGRTTTTSGTPSPPGQGQPVPTPTTKAPTPSVAAPDTDPNAAPSGVTPTSPTQSPSSPSPGESR